MVIFVLKSPQFSMNFHDKSKNNNQKIDFSFDSAHCTSFIKTGAKQRGGGEVGKRYIEKVIKKVGIKIYSNLFEFLCLTKC